MSDNGSREVWWGVRMLFEYVHAGQPEQEALYEEQVRLVRASSEDEARAKAAEVGQAEFHSYENMHGNEVRFTFREVLGAVELFDAELKDGSEVYYHFLGWTDVQNVRRMHEPGSLPESDPIA